MGEHAVLHKESSGDSLIQAQDLGHSKHAAQKSKPKYDAFGDGFEEFMAQVQKQEVETASHPGHDEDADDEVELDEVSSVSTDRDATRKAQQCAARLAVAKATCSLHFWKAKDKCASVPHSGDQSAASVKCTRTLGKAMTMCKAMLARHAVACSPSSKQKTASLAQAILREVSQKVANMQM